MRVCFFPSDFDAPGCYRCLFPARQLRDQYGWEAYKAPHRSEIVNDKGESRYLFDFRDLAAVDADLYVFQQAKQADAYQTVLNLRAAGKVVVFETDDWYLGTPSYNPGFEGAQRFDRTVRVSRGDQEHVVQVTRRHRRASPALARAAERPVNRDWMIRIMGECDAVTVATPVLAAGYGRPNTHVLRNYLDWDMWEDAPQQSELDRGGRVRVGWMGRMQYRSGDLAVLRGLVGPWLRRNPQVDFVAAGDGDELHDWLDVPHAQRVSTGNLHFRDLQLPSVTAVMDIGLVPLQTNRFNEAKSHLKGMEYAACGIPCVASPTDSYANYWLAGADNGRVGLLARRPRDWTRCLDLLVNDDGLRRTMGRAAREKAESHTIQRNAWRWKNLYERLVQVPVAA